MNAAMPPHDGRDWDAQCARCGSSVDREQCPTCCGNGYVNEDLYGCYIETVPCCDCDGHGGWCICLSSPDWCEAHPLAGRELVERGEVEWFPIPPT